MARNESISRGIVMNSDLLVEEEVKKRNASRESKRVAAKPQHASTEHRWSTYYPACRSCGTTTIPHVRKGLCEQCFGQFRGERREDIISAHQNACDSCGRKRHEAIATFGRDFYITKDKQVLCRECFAQHSGKILGSYRNFAWSRFYEKCANCGTTTVPHATKGLCENCSSALTKSQRDAIISERGSKCSRCSISRSEAQREYGKDLFIIKTNETLCRVCFQKYAKSGMRIAKVSKKAKAS